MCVSLGTCHGEDVKGLGPHGTVFMNAGFYSRCHCNAVKRF